jgi:hypothetical protein
MPPCNFTIDGPLDLKKGQAATYSVKPQPQHPCRTKITINGQDLSNAKLSFSIGGVSVTQIAVGVISVQALEDNPIFDITIILDCTDAVPPCGPTSKTIHIGMPAEPSVTLLDVLKTGLKIIALPVTLPLCGLCWLLWWIDVILNGKKNAQRSWICFVCDLLPW